MSLSFHTSYFEEVSKIASLLRELTRLQLTFGICTHSKNFSRLFNSHYYLNNKILYDYQSKYLISYIQSISYFNTFDQNSP